LTQDDDELAPAAPDRSLSYRTAREIAEWAHDHDLPYYDDQVHFPDLRIEYRELDGRADHEDVEVTTLHYRGGHGAAASKSGFTCFGRRARGVEAAARSTRTWRDFV
jgi:poly(3-hydroxybutyrate) depolymerase